MNWLNNQIDDLLRQIGELLGWLGTEILKGLFGDNPEDSDDSGSENDADIDDDDDIE